MFLQWFIGVIYCLCATTKLLMRGCLVLLVPAQYRYSSSLNHSMVYCCVLVCRSLVMIARMIYRFDRYPFTSLITCTSIQVHAVNRAFHHKRNCLLVKIRYQQLRNWSRFKDVFQELNKPQCNQSKYYIVNRFFVYTNLCEYTTHSGIIPPYGA